MVLRDEVEVWSWSSGPWKSSALSRFWPSTTASPWHGRAEPSPLPRRGGDQAAGVALHGEDQRGLAAANWPGRVGALRLKPGCTSLRIQPGATCAVLQHLRAAPSVAPGRGRADACQELQDGEEGHGQVPLGHKASEDSDSRTPPGRPSTMLAARLRTCCCWLRLLLQRVEDSPSVPACVKHFTPSCLCWRPGPGREGPEPGDVRCGPRRGRARLRH